MALGSKPGGGAPGDGGGGRGGVMVVLLLVVEELRGVDGDCCCRWSAKEGGMAR